MLIFLRGTVSFPSELELGLKCEKLKSSAAMLDQILKKLCFGSMTSHYFEYEFSRPENNIEIGLHYDVKPYEGCRKHRNGKFYSECCLTCIALHELLDYQLFV